MAAAYVGALELVDDLVDRGVDLDVRDESGYTALMFAANGEQAEVVRALLDAGADPDAADRFGNTVLMFAAQHGDTSAIKRLLASGADAIRRRVNDGLQAHDIAEANGHARAAAILRAAATAAGCRRPAGRSASRSASAISANRVVTWAGAARAEQLARDVHRRRHPDAGASPVEVVEVDPPARTARGTVALDPDDVIDRLEF